MQELIEAIKAAVAEGATVEQKTSGAAACRTILIALGAESGKPIAVANAPTPHPLAGIDPGQAIDLLIARLTAALPKDDKGATAPTPRRNDRGLRIEFVTPPSRRAAPPRRRRP